MWLLHVPFYFDTDLPYRSGPDMRKVLGTPDERADPFRRYWGEVQFACAELHPFGVDRNGFPMNDRLEDFGKVIFQKFHRVPCDSTPENPVTLGTLAKQIHGLAVEYVSLWHLVAVHAARIARYETMEHAVTYVSCAVPLVVVHGQITYREPKAAGVAEGSGAK